eukprot:6178076-Pleurochrysis_carterae.AAC.1
MSVLRKKKDEQDELVKYKAHAVVSGNQQKRTALASHRHKAHSRDVCAGSALRCIQTSVCSVMHCESLNKRIRRRGRGRLPAKEVRRQQ